MEDEIIIDVKALLQTVKQHLVVIIAVALAGGVVAWGIANFCITPQYQASAMMIVNNSAKSNESVSVSSSDISAAQSLTDTYAIIIKSDAVLDPVIQNMNLNTTSSSLAQQISVVSVDSTQIIQITYQAVDPEHARQVVEEIITVAPDIIVDKVEASSCKIISESKVSTSPVSPNVKKTTAWGFLLGLIVSAGFYILCELLDRTIRSEEQLTEITKVPNLGIIYKK